MASANTLTNLIPDFYESLDTVSRELTGFIPAVTLDANANRAAVNQVITSFVAPASTASDITAGAYAPDSGGQVLGNKTLTITKARAVPVQWTGEEQLSVSAGHGFGRIFQNQISQAMRTLVNEVEADVAALYTKASRAYGAATTTAFASDLSDPANLRKILADNGAPMSDLQLVIDTTAGAKMRTLAQLTKANEGGSDALLRQGELLNIHGFSIRESAGVATHTAGAMASATTTSAALTIGQTVLPLATAGTGKVAAGDVITIANDSNKYVVADVSFAGANPASGDSITIQGTGIRVAQGVAARAITVIATSVRNMAFARSAIVLATRAPAIPQGGDSAADATIVTDPRSGLSFEVRMYKAYRQVHYEVALAWGASVQKEDHLALLLG